MAKAELIRQALATHGQLIMPGVYDALSAKIAARAGFEVIFITGYSLSATLLGEPDFGLLTQTEVVSAAQRICSVVETPVIVDADTGYGNAINVIRTVQDLDPRRSRRNVFRRSSLAQTLRPHARQASDSLGRAAKQAARRG